jgi:hypothetical protein
MNILKTIFRFAISLLLAICLLGTGSLIYSPTAAAVTQIRLFDLDYAQCPPEMAEGAVGSSESVMFANCYLITGKAENKSGKPVIDADIFGRIYDANGNPVIQNRTRLGAIPEVPPGVSEFEMQITVPEDMPTPLSLEQFKASGFSTKVR